MARAVNKNKIARIDEIKQNKIARVAGHSVGHMHIRVESDLCQAGVSHFASCQISPCKAAKSEFVS